MLSNASHESYNHPMWVAGSERSGVPRPLTPCLSATTPNWQAGGVGLRAADPLLGSLLLASRTSVASLGQSSCEQTLFLAEQCHSAWNHRNIRHSFKVHPIRYRQSVPCLASLNLLWLEEAVTMEKAERQDIGYRTTVSCVSVGLSCARSIFLCSFLFDPWQTGGPLQLGRCKD